MEKGTLRTLVYVDGFNFYYGAVRGTPWKWLDIERFFRRLLGRENRLVGIKYFTAKVRPSPRDPLAYLRQNVYLRALRQHCPLVEIHLGHFLRHAVMMENADPPPHSVRVWKTEEKGSDVNLALHLLNDAWRGTYDCAVVVSNDSDLCEAMRLVRIQHHKVIGLVTPGAPRRKASVQLERHADFSRRATTWMFEKNQLPRTIPGTNITKPEGW